MTSFYVKNSFGLILSLKDGIAEVSGLQKVQLGELVSAESNFGLSLNLNKYKIGVVFLAETNLKTGSFVSRLYDLINVNVSIFVLNAVLNSLGVNLKWKLIQSVKPLIFIDAPQRAVELKAPGILIRQSVYESLYTGVKAVDCIIPIGQGQRELIIGDRQTGKTAIAIDAIIHQTF